MYRLYGFLILQQPSLIFGVGTSVYHENSQAVYAAIILVIFAVFFDPSIFVFLRIIKGTYQSVHVKFNTSFLEYEVSFPQ